MKSIVRIVKEVLNMPYYRNYQAVSGKVHNDANHETAVENILVANGCSPSDIGKIPIETRDKWLDGKPSPEMGNMTYISQPCGKNNSPDFIVKDENGELFFLECKSAKAGTPMYNSGVPKAKYIYILSSKKHDATTVYMGKDCLPSETRKIILEHIEEARKRDEALNEVLKSRGVINNYNISYYTRPMIQHAGAKEHTDYFINENRLINEANVFSYIEQGA